MNEKENNTMKMNEMNYAHKKIAIVSKCTSPSSWRIDEEGALDNNE